jgi:hypothetical protein
MYPWRVVHRYFAPGSTFDTLIVVYDEAYRPPRTVRLGAKRYAVFDVECRRVERGGEWRGFSDPINLDDVQAWGYRPVRYLTVLERKKGGGTIARALFEKPLPVLRARFSDGTATYKLPLPLGVTP